ncbi:DUF4959 domain-containing protein [Thalassobellus citreus]|uniref:DUF4959 domain-containing protein n=1 Tax=Thalassobellus citreus TaxID=3367752 RepID=UPI0037898792
MKKILFIILVVAGIYSCNKDDDAYLDVKTDRDTISFEAVEGGAVMRFTVDDTRIYRVKAVYEDQYGLPVVKLASFGNESMLLTGFNEPQSSVNVSVSYLDKNDNESSPMDFTFSTLASAVYSFFDEAEVLPYWDGFAVTYKAPEVVSGFANVYFLGTNPTTKLQDSILVETFPIAKGGDTRVYSLDESQLADYNTVIITTEDYKQRIARSKTWEDVESYTRVKLPNTDFELIDPFWLSYEDKNDWIPSSPVRFGAEYLFDGDIKGTQRFQNAKPGWEPAQYTFYAGPGATQDFYGDQMYFVLDIKKANVVGELRFYAMLEDNTTLLELFNYDYYTRVPCKMKVYGCNDYVLSSDPTAETGSWKELGSFNNDPKQAIEDRWYVEKSTGFTHYITSLAEQEAADPVYISIPLEFDSTAYRYFKIEVLDTYDNLFAPDYHNNYDDYVSFHEIELYAKKD